MGTRRSRHNKGRKIHHTHYAVVHVTCGDCFQPMVVLVKDLHIPREEKTAHRCQDCVRRLGPIAKKHYHARAKTRPAAEREKAVVREISALAALPVVNARPAPWRPPPTPPMSTVRAVAPPPKLPFDPDSEAERQLYMTWTRLMGRGKKWFDAHICDRWRNSFADFAKDMGTRPSKRHQLRRLDEAKPYSPDNCAWFTVDDERKSRLKVVPLSKLQNDIVRPGIEKTLIPLCLYKGTRTVGRIHRLWNFAIAMMHTECDSLTDGVAISHNADFSHLCGPLSKAQRSTLQGFFSRLRMNPQVTDSIQGLTEYARHVLPSYFELAPVSAIADRRTRIAPWREFANKREKARLAREEAARWAVPVGGPGNVKLSQVKSEDMFYPFVMHEAGTPMDRLVAIVHACVPPGLPPEFRADICQDLIVDLLSGELTEAALVGSPRKYVGPKLKHYRFEPWQQSMDTELIDILQHDEAKRRFDEYVEEQLSDVFRISRGGAEHGEEAGSWADA